jgi:Family of unknown function (DUF6338)
VPRPDVVVVGQAIAASAALLTIIYASSTVLPVQADWKPSAVVSRAENHELDAHIGYLLFWGWATLVLAAVAGRAFGWAVDAGMLKTLRIEPRPPSNWRNLVTSVKAENLRQVAQTTPDLLLTSVRTKRGELFTGLLQESDVSRPDARPDDLYLVGVYDQQGRFQRTRSVYIRGDEVESIWITPASQLTI